MVSDYSTLPRDISNAIITSDIKYDCLHLLQHTHTHINDRIYPKKKIYIYMLI